MTTACDELNGFVRQLSRHIGCNIKQLARALNAESTIFELDRQYPRDLKELIRSFFEKWLKMEEGHASIDQLMRGLKAAELYETLAKMEAYVQEGILCSAFIRELSRHIGSDLRKLSRALDIDKTDFDAIEYRDPRDLKEQIVQFFRFWEEREGSKASVETLMAALKRAELFEVVNKMELFIKQEKAKVKTVPLLHMSCDGNTAETELAGLIPAPQWQPLHKFSVQKATSFRATREDKESNYLQRGRCNSDGAYLRNTRTRNRPPSSHMCDETETQLLFFCPNNIALNDLQSLAKGTTTNVQILSPRTSSGCVRAVIRGSIAACCEILSKHLKQRLHSSQNIVKKSVVIENGHQWGQVIGKNGCVNKAIKSLSGANVWIEESDIYPRSCHVQGHPKQVKMAEELLRRTMEGEDILKEATMQNILSQVKKDLIEFCGFQFEGVT
eukprot:Em0016g353a